MLISFKNSMNLKRALIAVTISLVCSAIGYIIAGEKGIYLMIPLMISLVNYFETRSYIAASIAGVASMLSYAVILLIAYYCFGYSLLAI